MIDVTGLDGVYNEYNRKVLGDLIQQVADSGGAAFAESLLKAIMAKDTPDLERTLRINTKDAVNMTADMNDYNRLLRDVKAAYDWAQRYNSKLAFDKCDDCDMSDGTVRYRDNLQRYLCDDCYNKTVTPSTRIKPAVLRGVQMYSGGRTIELPEDYYPFDGVEED